MQNKEILIIAGEEKSISDIKKDYNEFREEYKDKLLANKHLYKFYSNEYVNGINYTHERLKTDTIYLQSPNDFKNLYDAHNFVDKDTFYNLAYKELFLKAKEKYQASDKKEERFDKIFATDNESDASKLYDEMRLPMGRYEHATYGTLGARFYYDGIGILDIRLQMDKYYDEYVKGDKSYKVSTFFGNTDFNYMFNSEYSGYGKGICVEYKFGYNIDDILENIYPVVYHDKCDFPKNYIKNLDGDLTNEEINLQFVDCYLSKDIKYVNEQEWRYITPSCNNDIADFLKISKVYLGPNMSAIEKKKVIDICEDRNIDYVFTKFDRTNNEVIVNEHFELTNYEKFLKELIIEIANVIYPGYQVFFTLFAPYKLVFLDDENTLHVCLEKIYDDIRYKTYDEMVEYFKNI